MPKKTLTPTLLLILDGWGQAPAGPGNAVTLAKMPAVNALMALPSRTTLLCSGRAVGLPDGYMGNSEVGHMNIGAGRIVYQDMTRIDIALEDGSFFTNPAISETIAAAKKSGGALHLLGLLSDGGVHSHIRHLFALIEAARKEGVPVRIHAFMDGRDTAPDSGLGFMRQLVERRGPGARVASISGRYYAMDRDNRWERIQQAWDTMINGQGPRFADPLAAVQAAYDEKQTDEFITPRLIVPEGGEPTVIKDGDAVFFFNFRADRARQLSQCLFDPNFTEFDRRRLPRLAAFATMSAYEAGFPMPVAFHRQNLEHGLGQVASDAGLKQLRIAETEKYAHVTYFFNGGVEEPFPGEDRRLIPSPRDVATYDLKPEMSVNEVCDTLLKDWASGAYDLVVCNFANLDMVGHSGILPAAIKACEAVDACVAKAMEAVRASKGRLLVTADHGNAEEMLTPDGHPYTAHTTNPVALVLMDEDAPRKLKPGKLGDIAPTILALWDLPIPEEMTGESLLED
jgi:2,3-bisphosphoglycerate-independent phosphoglycerate mutase